LIADCLTAIGYDEIKPAVPNDMPDNKARNRRVEFSVVPN
jgi:outer membrane protein OmpA-like peptidoglycan-associated protein